ncbi:UNVERIFIED_CONTAM: hypothetical protein K2H54_058187 [Gekko kuhli]
MASQDKQASEINWPSVRFAYQINMQVVLKIRMKKQMLISDWGICELFRCTPEKRPATSHEDQRLDDIVQTLLLM